jgi:signal peptidase I
VSLDSCGPDQTSVTIPDGKVFVLGDNRASSIDSREFGPVDDTAVLGRVVRVTGIDGVERAIEIP